MPPKNLGVPVSSRGTLEYNRVDLTLYLDNRLRVDLPMPYSLVCHVEVLHDLLPFHRVLVRPALRVAGGQRVEPGPGAAV